MFHQKAPLALAAVAAASLAGQPEQADAQPRIQFPTPVVSSFPDRQEVQLTRTPYTPSNFESQFSSPPPRNDAFSGLAFPQQGASRPQDQLLSASPHEISATQAASGARDVGLYVSQQIEKLPSWFTLLAGAAGSLWTYFTGRDIVRSLSQRDRKASHGGKALFMD